MKKTLRRNGGFTLTEVVIAVLVAGIGIAGVMSMVLWMVRANGWSGNMTTAALMGQDKFEDFQETDYANITDGSDSVEHFTRVWTVSDVNNEYRTVDLEVSWERPNGSVSRVAMAGLRSNPVVPGVDLSPFNLGGVGGAGGGGGGGEDPPPDDGGGDPDPYEVIPEPL